MYHICNYVRHWYLTGCLRKRKNAGHFAIFGKINHISIGHLILKCPFGIIVSTKIATKNVKRGLINKE